MPNGKIHKVVGIGSGAAYAGYRARHEQDPAYFLARVVGGAIGGNFGGASPDLAEPASWPGHRQVAHSVAVSGAIIKATPPLLDKWEVVMYEKVDKIRSQRLTGQGTTVDNVILGLAELACMFLAGLPAGYTAGYVSHVGLDACTGKIPLVGCLDSTLQTRDLHMRRLARRTAVLNRPGLFGDLVN